MIVTGIERQKRHPERVNIYLEGKFAFGIHQDVLVKYGLRKGDEIDDRTLNSISSDQEIALAKQKAMRLLHYRMRSVHEMRHRLTEKKFPPAVIDTVMEQLQNTGLLDDLVFAKACIHDLQLKKPAGMRLLRQHLLKRGVPQAIINEVLQDSPGHDDEFHMALTAAKAQLKRLQSSRKKTEIQKQQQRLAGFLTRRGFSWSVITPILKQLFQNVELQEEDHDVIGRV
ncbi:MAG TPA: RecX family transcriptional regulator [Bacteroidota bacterium]|nr:RecX family transcriptional regulator [Bacteroidota bacterium]